MKRTNIQIIGITEGQEMEKGIETLLEKILAKIFPNLEKRKAKQVQKAGEVPIEMKTKRPTSRHIIIKRQSFIFFNFYCYSITVVCLFSAERKKELIPFATAWMELESIMLSEMSQAVWDKYHMISPLTGT